jgi:hypothetical protein
VDESSLIKQIKGTENSGRVKQKFWLQTNAALLGSQCSAKIWLPTFRLPPLHPPSPNQAQLQKYQKKLSTSLVLLFFFLPNVSIGDILIKHPQRAQESYSQIKIPSTDHSPWVTRLIKSGADLRPGQKKRESQLIMATDDAELVCARGCKFIEEPTFNAICGQAAPVIFFYYFLAEVGVYSQTRCLWVFVFAAEKLFNPCARRNVGRCINHLLSILQLLHPTPNGAARSRTGGLGLGGSGMLLG